MTSLFKGWLGVLYRHLITEDMGTSFITAMFALLVEKITKMARPATKQQKKKGDGDDDDTALNTGEISNLFGNDIMKRFRDFLIASNLPMALSAACGAVGTLIFLLGIPALASTVPPPIQKTNKQTINMACRIPVSVLHIRVARDNLIWCYGAPLSLVATSAP